MNAAGLGIRRHKLTAAEYHRMADCGILAPEARVELIDGEIIDMAPQGSAHASIVSALHDRLATLVQPDYQVRCQMPVALGDRSEPEPHLSVVKGRSDYYRGGHPRQRDVLLLVEVADKSLAYDRTVKAKLYSKHAVPTVWIVDAAARELHCFSEPAPDGYRRCMTSDAGASVALPSPFVGQISLKDIL